MFVFHLQLNCSCIFLFGSVQTFFSPRLPVFCAQIKAGVNLKGVKVFFVLLKVEFTSSLRTLPSYIVLLSFNWPFTEVNIFSLFVNIPAQFWQTKQWQGIDLQQITKTTSFFLIYLGLHGCREWRCSVSVFPSLPSFSHPQICLCITPPAAKSCWSNPFSLCVWVFGCCVAMSSRGLRQSPGVSLWGETSSFSGLQVDSTSTSQEAQEATESSPQQGVLITQVRF